MEISYNKLWNLQVDKKMSKAELRKKAGVAPNIMPACAATRRSP